MPRLSKAERVEVTELIKNGKSLREVAKKMNTSHSTIQRLIKRHNETGSIDDRPRSGRPRVPLIAESSWFECVGQKRSFVCTECGKTFNRYHGLKNHIQIHSADRRLQCDQCGRGFYNNSSLKRHLRTHTGEKPYICEYCARGFADMGTMTTHIRTHTGERPHKCHLCDHACRSAGNLHHHMRVHKDQDGNIPRPINVQPTKAQAVPIFEGINVLRKARRKYERLNDGSWLGDTTDSDSDDERSFHNNSWPVTAFKSENGVDDSPQTAFKSEDDLDDSPNTAFKNEDRVSLKEESEQGNGEEDKHDLTPDEDSVEVKEEFPAEYRDEWKDKDEVKGEAVDLTVKRDIKQEPIDDESND